MKKSISIVFAFLLFLTVASSQPIPLDSLYLGQTLPGNIPEMLQLQASPEHFVAERITISNDGREIFYSEIKSYYPINSARVKSYRFTDGKWTGPFIIFEGFCSPALSVTGDTMYFENGIAETYFSIKNGIKWSAPKRILPNLESAHYLQSTSKGNHYISSKPRESIGFADWCELDFTASDTTAVSLGTPLNTAWDNLDFFVPRDESFMIVTTPFGLSISYPKNDGSWTNPRNLGTKINFGLGMWGPYVTPDNKYLFYTTGTKPDYSDVYVYWVRVDGLIDSLKYTNIPPYFKNKVESQNGFVGDLFKLTIPDNTFFDEDGDTSFTYSVCLVNGEPLPSWLNFDARTKTFSGKPQEAGELKIILTAADSKNDTGIGVFKLIITAKP